MFTGLLSCKTKLMGSFTQALEAISTNVCTYICVCTQPAAGAVASRASPSHILSSLSRISKDTPAFFDQSVDNSHIACPIIHNCSSKLLSEFVSKASPFSSLFLAAERDGILLDHEYIRWRCKVIVLPERTLAARRGREAEAARREVRAAELELHCRKAGGEIRLVGFGFFDRLFSVIVLLPRFLPEGN